MAPSKVIMTPPQWPGFVANGTMQQKIQRNRRYNLWVRYSNHLRPPYNRRANRIPVVEESGLSLGPIYKTQMQNYVWADWDRVSQHYGFGWVDPGNNDMTVFQRKWMAFLGIRAAHAG